jgi:hypothetical protein
VSDPFIPSALGIIASPNTDTDDAYNAMYVFEEDFQNYEYDLQSVLTERVYDPNLDPYADHRSIAAEYEGQLPALSDTLIDFAGFLGLPITFLPDVSPS